ncbi:MAG TPA: hypothetical protein VFT50_06460 [Baekduia sp.]|nr:hypothetical protein [Baekduia sp.]
MTAPPVDLVVNCFERSYRKVLAPGFFGAIEADNVRPFAMRTAVINNVDDRADADGRAQALVDAGEIDRYVFVADHLDDALARCGLTRADIEPIPYFTDFAIVAACLDGPDWMVHWDADVRLRPQVDWIGPAIELMERDRRVMVACPNWEVDNLAEQTLEEAGSFAIGQGFSDQAFLARRSELAAPIYRQRCLALRRYPLSHLGPIFEARVDAHMRHAGRLRAVFRDARYVHDVEMGTSWPARTLRERALQARDDLIIRTLRALPWRPRHLRQI